MTTIPETLADIPAALDSYPPLGISGAQLDTIVHDTPTVTDAPAEDDPFAFLLAETDDEILADFRAVGIDLEAPQSLDAAQRQAAASRLLRFAAAARLEASKHEATRDAEVALVEMHYATQIGRANDRARACEAAVEALAEIAKEKKDFGKKKSASTPFGTFGYRESSATVELADADALLAHLKAKLPTFVRTKVALTLAEAREYLTEDEIAKIAKLEPAWGDLKATLSADGELPPGVKRVGAKVVPFAKPDLLAVATLGGAA